MTRDERIVAEARRWIGTPYRAGASCCGAGCDCAGLVRGVWRAVCGAEPRGLPLTVAPALCATLARYCAPRAIAARQVGDILVFRARPGAEPAHCAILSGPDSLIHSHACRAVCERPMTRWWQRRLVAAFAFPDAA